jgi:hypothetical protein
LLAAPGHRVALVFRMIDCRSRQVARAMGVGGRCYACR